MIKVGLFGDLHCGHYVGLTPPDWQIKPSLNAKLARFQQETWDWYKTKVQEIGRLDAAFILGDMIDGTGYRSGGTEQITTDRTKQGEMAVKALSLIKADKMVMVFGTPSHTGDAEDFEIDVAKEMKCKIGSHEFPTIGNRTFDLKHYIGSSKKQEARFTALGNEIRANQEWASAGQQPRADIVVRAHCHYYGAVSNENAIGITLPALQGYGSKFGARKCSGRVNVGFVLLLIDKDITIRPILADKELKCFRAN